MAYLQLLNVDPSDRFATDWKGAHTQAFYQPKGFEVSVIEMLRGWLSYADEHAKRYQSGIGEDGLLGPAWAGIGVGIRILLNGDCGRLHCGTLDSILGGVLREEGFDADNL